MNVSLDLSSSRMRSLYLKDGVLKNRSIRSAYAIFPDDADIRDAFRQLKIPYASLDSRLTVYGDYSHRTGKMFGSPLRPLFPDGKLPRNDPPRRQLVSHLLDLLLPTSTGDDDICMMTVPGEWNLDNSEFLKTTEYLKRLVKLKNYEPIVVNPGLAAAFAELGNDNFTGLCVTVGDTHTHCCLTIHAREVLSICVPQATQWFLQEVARRTESHIWNRQGEKLLDVDRVATLLSNPEMVSDEGMNRTQSKAVEASLNHLLRHLFMQFSNGLRHLSGYQKRQLKLSTIPVLITGDLAVLVPAIAQSIEKTLNIVNMPFAVERVSLSKNPDLSVNRGCLICAELEQNVSYSEAA